MIDFKKNGKKYKEVSFVGVAKGTEMQLKLTNVSYYKDLIFGYFKDEDSSIRAIIGNKGDFEFEKLLSHKGEFLTVRFNGFNGEYPKLSVSW
jgi:IMP dehydrogenase/GMP reductase